MLALKEIKVLVSEEVAKYVGGMSNEAKYRRCFTCSEPFKLKNKNRCYCDSSCARRAHYIPFRIKKPKKA